MEIKKAFNQFKKELAKECGIEGGFTMSARQIESRTATYCVSTIVEFDDLIEQNTKTANTIMGYSNWSAESRKARYDDCMESVKRISALKEKYGTQRNRTIAMMNQIKNSKAFEKFQTEVGKTMLSVESTKEAWYIRFNY